MFGVGDFLFGVGNLLVKFLFAVLVVFKAVFVFGFAVGELFYAVVVRSEALVVLFDAVLKRDERVIRFVKLCGLCSFLIFKLCYAVGVVVLADIEQRAHLRESGFGFIELLAGLRELRFLRGEGGILFV